MTVAPPCGHGEIVLDAEISSLSMEKNFSSWKDRLSLLD